MNTNSPNASNKNSKNKKFSQQQQKQHRFKLSRTATTSSTNTNSSRYRFAFKAFLLLIFVCIVSIYHYLLSRIIIAGREGKGGGRGGGRGGGLASTNSNTNTNSSSNDKNMNAEKIKDNDGNKAVMIIASVPFNDIRGFSLWSQLECFTGKVDKVIITAAEYSKELMDRFVAEITREIPHFRDGTTSLEVRYYVNDRYDNGLWCDALNDGAGAGADIIKNTSPLLQEYDQFILVNDSIMAMKKSTELLDVLRSKQLQMVSLTYSLLGGSYWVESNYRGFDREGIRQLMDHICVPNPCLKRKGAKSQHRCMVDKFEIPTAALFDRSKVWGLYHGDAPIEYFNPKATKPVPMQLSPMWHSNYGYWNDILLEKQNFPAAKISNRWQYIWIKKKNMVDHDRCLSYLKKSPEAAKIAQNFEVLMEKADSVNQIEFRKYEGEKKEESK